MRRAYSERPAHGLLRLRLAAANGNRRAVFAVSESWAIKLVQPLGSPNGPWSSRGMPLRGDNVTGNWPGQRVSGVVSGPSQVATERGL